MAQPHDHLFRLVFTDPEHARALLRSALPAPVADAIDWPTLTRETPGHLGRRGRQTTCDLLFAVHTRGRRKLLLYVALEHKSQSRRCDALQVLEQVVAILRTHRRRHPRDRFLPPVLPVVVHADHRRWCSPRQVRELFDLAHLPAALHRFLPSLEFVLDDLHGQPAEHLRRRALTIFGLCALSTLQYLPKAAADEQRFTAWITAWADVQEQAARLTAAAPGQDLFDAVVDYVLATSPLPRRILHRALASQLSDATMKKFVSTLTQTRNEGKAEGKAEGRAELLLRLIARRFGRGAAAAHEERLRAASIDELDLWAERVLDAATIDAVFGDGAAPQGRKPKQR